MLNAQGVYDPHSPLWSSLYFIDRLSWKNFSLGKKTELQGQHYTLSPDPYYLKHDCSWHTPSSLVFQVRHNMDLCTYFSGSSSGGQNLLLKWKIMASHLPRQVKFWTAKRLLISSLSFSWPFQERLTWSSLAAAYQEDLLQTLAFWQTEKGTVKDSCFIYFSNTWMIPEVPSSLVELQVELLRLQKAVTWLYFSSAMRNFCKASANYVSSTPTRNKTH